MRLLVLGGTAFVGRHIVAEALRRGHDVTIFNRGRTNPRLFPQARRLTGDRESGDLDALSRGEWDGLIDVSGRRPEQVAASAELMHWRVGVYSFISTVAVYASATPVVSDEDSPVISSEASPRAPGIAYGAQKAACERIIQSTYRDRGVIFRPGIVIGPHDPTNRFNYWVQKMAAGGCVLGPPRPHQPVQTVFAPDLADFVVEITEQQEGAILNCVGPPTTFSAMLSSCSAASGAESDVIWVAEYLLRRHGISLPFSLPERGDRDGAYLRSNERATSRGMRNRSIEECAKSVLAWMARTHRAPSADTPAAAEEARLMSTLVSELPANDTKKLT